MNNYIEILLLVPSAISVGAAAYLAFQGKDGWGWFLFVGLLLAGAVLKGDA